MSSTQINKIEVPDYNLKLTTYQSMLMKVSKSRIDIHQMAVTFIMKSKHSFVSIKTNLHKHYFLM